MKAAKIVDRAGLLQNIGHRLLRRHHHVEIAVFRSRRVRQNVLVDQLKGIVRARQLPAVTLLLGILTMRI